MNPVSLLEKITSFQSVSGNEALLVSYLKTITKPFADKVYTDAFGNLICQKGSDYRALVAFAHVDKVGFVVSKLGKKTEVVGVYKEIEEKLASKVYSMRVYHHNYSLPAKLKKVGSKIVLSLKDNKLICVGDSVSYRPNFKVKSDGAIISQGLDNSLGVVSAISLLKYLKSGTVVFSVQEEMGFYGAAAAARKIQPKKVLIIDATYADDPASAVKEGGGVSLCLKDDFVSNKEMVAEAIAVCQKKKINYQLEVLTSGKSDIAGVYAGCGPVPHLFVGIPISGMHSHEERVEPKDLFATIKLLRNYGQIVS